MKDFNQNLIEAREKAGITQKRLAELLEITPTRLNYWEKGKREPDVAMIKKISSILHVDPNFLIGIKNIEPDFTESEKQLINQYRPLSPESKKRVDNVLHFEYELWVKDFKEKSLSEISFIEGEAAAWGGKREESKITPEESMRGVTLLNKIQKTQKEIHQ